MSPDVFSGPFDAFRDVLSEVEKLGSSRKTRQHEHFTIWLNPAEAVGMWGWS